MVLSDETLTCRDCGVEFVFTVGEQEFYASKGFTNKPSRCPSCRSARKARVYDGDPMGGGGRGYGERPRREMHVATCAKCGGEAQVPFVPRGDRPVYCSRCFDEIRGQVR